MKDEILIREISQIKALQSVTLHVLRLFIESAGEAFGKEMQIKSKTQDLLAALEVEYENRLRAEQGLPLRQVTGDKTFAENFPEWPEFLGSTDSDEFQDDQ